MHFERGTKAVLNGRYEDFTEHLDGTTVTIIDGDPDAQGYIQIIDQEGSFWYVQAIDVKPI